MVNRLLSSVDPSYWDKVQLTVSRLKEPLDPNKKQLYWVHDLAEDPAVSHLRDGGWKKFDLIVFVSHWQQAMYNKVLGVPYENGIVFQNAIEPIKGDRTKSDKIRLIYTSTPQRGLNLLVPTFQELKDRHNIELHVYSSFETHGWPEKDKPFEHLFQLMDEPPGIFNHGSVPNDEIRKALLSADIFVLPGTWPETSCLALIEALCAGCDAIHSSHAALPETAKGMTTMYPFFENEEFHHIILKSHLDRMLTNYKPIPKTVRSFFNNYHDWNKVKENWELTLKTLVHS